MTWFGIASFATAALVYGAITGVLLASNPGGRAASWTMAATAMSAVWAAGNLLLLTRSAPSAVVIGLDGLHALVWTACVLSWLSPSLGRRWPARRLMLAASAAFVAWAVIESYSAAAVPLGSEMQGSFTDRIGSGVPGSVWLAQLAANLIGLMAIEQVFRNAREEQVKSLRLLCLGLGTMFVGNVFVFSHATLLGGLVPVLWEGRAFLHVLVAPLILIALKRQAEWATELFVSRQVAFYTATLAAVGVYLLAMGLVGYIIRGIGGQWGLVFEILFFVAALVVLVCLLFSASLRARAKVFLVKHFYRNKYDYRQEWLRLTQALSGTGDVRTLAANALHGVARIVGSRDGALWLAADGGQYQQAARLNGGTLYAQKYDAMHPVVTFLKSHGWVIDSEEYRHSPDRYGNAFGDPQDGVLPPESLFVPLDCKGDLEGFVVLTKPPEVDALNFEDHDILKTAGRQVAIVLAQARAQEQLTATRQFEAVNKLATFLMHDLKNVVAQQELVLANAQRFGHRPEFFADAMTTMRASVGRMRKVLDQLRAAAQSEPSRTRADLSKVLMEVRSHCADRDPVPQVDVSLGTVWVEMDRDRLASVLTHVIRNAQDATPPDGEIKVEVQHEGDQLLISIADTGHGMDAAFIKDRLFRPFDSTKGAKGMGIGAYQVRETVRACGGDVEVQSDVGVGTIFRIRLPAVPVTGSSAVTLPAA